ncbi:MAG: ABC transporter substrate-binding protein [Spirochaetaceae bacterium]|jgi:putative ABC transport system substrate-binding protein|nr:ABC transporter substrate-binding protein [Spirochaetaceae bacterium]
MALKKSLDNGNGRVKKLKFVCLLLFFAVFCVAVESCEKKTSHSKTCSNKHINIGISKIVQHEALDAIEQGIQDGLKAHGVDAIYDLQNANNDMSTASQIAIKFRSSKVDVAIGITTPASQALANAIKDIPVVFATVTDPVAAALVRTTEHGEGNVTGLSDAVPTSEHIKLFKEVAGIKSLGYIYTPQEANSLSTLHQVEAACAVNGIALVTQSINTSADIKQAAQAIVGRVDGLYLSTDNTVFSGLQAIINVFHIAKKPIFSADVTGAKRGGCLIASGFNYYKAGLATADIVYDILQGKKPQDIPVKFLTDPSELDLLIDLDEAENCGIIIPPDLIASANKIYKNGKLDEK